MELNGSCHCGKTNVTTNRESVAGIIKCHCVDCQKHLGNFAPWVVCAKDDTSINGEVGEYQSSEGVNRLFCTACGASIGKKPDEGDKIVFVAGIFDKPLEIEVIDEIFTESKEEWM